MKPHKISTHLAYSENSNFHLFFFRLSDWVEILQGFTKFNFKLNLRVSAFYLENKKSFIPKKKFLGRCQYQNKSALFTDSIFQKVLVYLPSPWAWLWASNQLLWSACHILLSMHAILPFLCLGKYFRFDLGVGVLVLVEQKMWRESIIFSDLQNFANSQPLASNFKGFSWSVELFFSQ